DAAQLVELHVGVDLPAGVAVHDPLFPQGRGGRHDDAAGHLRLAALLVDDQATVLHRHHPRAADHAGLGVHLDLRDLHAADAAVGQARRPVAAADDGVHAELGTRLLPLPLLVATLVHDQARL